MRTLYLRNVPDEVAAGLEQLARKQGMSLNGFAVRELTEIAKRSRNAALLDALPDAGTSGDEILRAVHEGRGEP